MGPQPELCQRWGSLWPGCTLVSSQSPAQLCSGDHHLFSTDVGWLLAGVKVVYLLALFVSQENQMHSNPEVYMLKWENNISIQETTKQKVTKNSMLCLQDRKCKELSLNNYIIILQIKEQFLPLSIQKVYQASISHTVAAPPEELII